MQEATVSVIVPVYNTEQYLDRCVQSIVNQTYKNLEIILVDDGSPDRCPQICDKWAERDARIRVIHKENEGLGCARNTGIDNATGTYICFFDSDDYVDADTLASAHSLAQSYDADLVCFGLRSVNAEGTVVETRIPNCEERVFRADMVRNDFLLKTIDRDPATGRDYGIPMSACCKLYSMRCIRKNHWRFVSERDIISEDFYSLMLLYPDVETVCILPAACYNYCENRKSLTHSYREDRFDRIGHFYIEITKLCDALNYPREVGYRLGRIYLSFVISAMKSAMSSDLPMRQKRAGIQKMLQNDLLQQVLKEHRNDQMNWKKRILFTVMRHCCTELSCVLLSAQNAVS